MPRYIDAERFKLWVQDNYVLYDGDRYLKDIDAQPTADVVERKKAKWIDRSAYCVCNLCGHTEQQFNGVQPIPRHTPFCATCGAEMEEIDG